MKRRQVQISVQISSVFQSSGCGIFYYLLNWSVYTAKVVDNEHMAC